MILTSLDIDPAELHERTGWAIKPEGACKDDVCVPVAAAAATATRVAARVMFDRLGMPLIHDEAAGLWCLGPEAMGRGLTTARAPHLALADLAGTCSGWTRSGDARLSLSPGPRGEGAGGTCPCGKRSGPSCIRKG